MLKEVNKANADASRVKVRFHEIASGVQSIVQAVDVQAAWHWLKVAPGLLAPLVDANKKMMDGLSPFARKFLDFGVKDARKDMDNHATLAALREFKLVMDPLLAAAERQLSFLKSTHALREQM